MADYLTIADGWREHKIGGFGARAVEAEFHQIVVKIYGMHAGTVIVGKVFNHPVVAESFKRIGAFVVDNRAVDFFHTQAVERSHHLSHNVWVRSKMARTERRVAKSFHYHVATQAVALQFANGAHCGVKTVVFAQQSQRRCRRHRLHRGGCGDCQIGSVRSQHRAAVHVHHTHAHRGVAQIVGFSKTVNRHLKFVHLSHGATGKQHTSGNSKYSFHNQ